MKLFTQATQAIAWAALITSATAWADTTITFVNVDTEGSETASTEVAAGKMRISTPDGDGYMVFDADSNSFTAVNNKDRSYMVFDQAQVEKLANMQKQVMDQMEAQLAQLPPGQREQMRRMMGSMMPQMPEQPEPRRYVRTGDEKTVGKFDCETLLVYAGERKISEQCVIDRDALDISDEDFATVQAMQQFMSDLVNSFARMSDQVVEFGEPGSDEFPVEFIHYSKVAGESRGQLSSISHDPVDPARFAIPADYKQQKIPDMPKF